MSRPWLRHPPRTIHPPLTCPTPGPHFATLHLARAALTAALADARLTATECDLCQGAHHKPA